MRALRATLDLNPTSLPRRQPPRVAAVVAARTRRKDPYASPPKSPVGNVVRLVVTPKTLLTGRDATEMLTAPPAAIPPARAGSEAPQSSAAALRTQHVKTGPTKRKQRRKRAKEAQLLEGAAFDAAVQTHKMVQSEQRWSAWPFNHDSSAALPLAGGKSGGSAPPRMRAPHAISISADAATLGWEALPASAGAAGYELELAGVNALDGQEAWRRIYRGPKLQSIADGLGRQLIGVRARVRAYNGSGKGEWSPRSELLRLLAIPPPTHREIEEIPAEWLSVDLAGLPELSAREVNPALLDMTKADLVKSLHANRSIIKMAFRYYALAGGDGRPLHASRMPRASAHMHCLHLAAEVLPHLHCCIYPIACHHVACKQASQMSMTTHPP